MGINLLAKAIECDAHALAVKVAPTHKECDVVRRIKGEMDAGRIVIANVLRSGLNESGYVSYSK